jgi:exopolysaccharide production protein ExoY
MMIDFRGAPVFGRPQPGWKRGIDIAGALLGIVGLSPLFFLVAVYITLVSPGPVFFRPLRVGYRGRAFRMWKFRTMCVNADAALHEQWVAHKIATDEPLAKLDHDPRIIPLGLVLRLSGLDELPQLFNVLRGDMSLIGPRPECLYTLRQYRPWHTERFDALPGMTGLWQVSGKNTTTFTEMMRLDIAYVRRRSLWLDVQILVATPVAVLGQCADTLLGRHKPAMAPTPQS